MPQIAPVQVIRPEYVNALPSYLGAAATVYQALSQAQNQRATQQYYQGQLRNAAMADVEKMAPGDQRQALLNRKIDPGQDFQGLNTPEQARTNASAQDDLRVGGLLPGGPDMSTLPAGPSPPATPAPTQSAAPPPQSTSDPGTVAAAQVGAAMPVSQTSEGGIDLAQATQQARQPNFQQTAQMLAQHLQTPPGPDGLQAPDHPVAQAADLHHAIAAPGISSGAPNEVRDRVGVGDHATGDAVTSVFTGKQPAVENSLPVIMARNQMLAAMAHGSPAEREAESQQFQLALHETPEQRAQRLDAINSRYGVGPLDVNMASVIAAHQPDGPPLPPAAEEWQRTHPVAFQNASLAAAKEHAGIFTGAQQEQGRLTAQERSNQSAERIATQQVQAHIYGIDAQTDNEKARLAQQQQQFDSGQRVGVDQFNRQLEETHQMHLLEADRLGRSLDLQNAGMWKGYLVDADSRLYRANQAMNIANSQVAKYETVLNPAGKAAEARYLQAQAAMDAAKVRAGNMAAGALPGAQGEAVRQQAAQIIQDANGQLEAAKAVVGGGLNPQDLPGYQNALRDYADQRREVDRASSAYLSDRQHMGQVLGALRTGGSAAPGPGQPSPSASPTTSLPGATTGALDQILHGATTQNYAQLRQQAIATATAHGGDPMAVGNYMDQHWQGRQGGGTPGVLPDVRTYARPTDAEMDRAIAGGGSLPPPPSATTAAPPAGSTSHPQGSASPAGGQWPFGTTPGPAANAMRPASVPHTPPTRPTAPASSTSTSATDYGNAYFAPGAPPRDAAGKTRGAGVQTWDLTSPQAAAGTMSHAGDVLFARYLGHPNTSLLSELSGLQRYITQRSVTEGATPQQAQVFADWGVRQIERRFSQLTGAGGSGIFDGSAPPSVRPPAPPPGSPEQAEQQILSDPTVQQAGREIRR